MTLKKALQRGLFGIPMGVFVGYTITILIALVQYDTGIYHPVVPKLSEVTGNEIFAVIIQYLLCAALGFAFAVGSAVFEVEEWGITKQTVIHFLITTIALFPVAYIN
jgi:hypothetical protein